MSYIITEKLTSTIAVYMIAKRLLTPWKQWAAFKQGLIDENGKRIRKVRSSKDRQTFDLLDRFVWALKRIVTKTIGDNKLVYLFSAAYLMKEDITKIIKSDLSKYDEELKDFTVSKQKIIFEIIKEMEKQNLLVESNLDFETNLIKILPKCKLIIDRYNLNELFESKQVGILYHYTSIDKALRILMSDEFKAKEYVSFTRNKKFLTSYKNRTIDIECRFVIDGDVLSHSHKITPYNDFEKELIRTYRHRPKDDESEERVKGDIKNATRYIIKLQIFDTSDNRNYFKRNEDVFKKLEELCEVDFIIKESILKESTRPTTNSLGQPIHSTQEGINNFWKWFGDSKVVDDQGRPLVVYHGSHTPDIELFDVERAGTIQTSDWGKGIYFTPSERSADYYRKTAITQTNEYVDKLYDEYEQAAKDLGTTPMNAYLDLGFGEKYDQLKVYKNRWIDASDKIRQSDAGKVYSAYLKILDPYRESWGGITDPYMADRAISNGKDGIIIGDFEEVIVFKSSQIKSLDNNGNFSSNSNLITEEGEATTLGDISQFTQKIGTTQRRKFNPLIITKHANKLRKRRYTNVSNNL